MPRILSSSLFLSGVQVCAVSVSSESYQGVISQVSHCDLIFVDHVPNFELVGEDLYVLTVCAVEIGEKVFSQLQERKEWLIDSEDKFNVVYRYSTVESSH